MVIVNKEISRWNTVHILWSLTALCLNWDVTGGAAPVAQGQPPALLAGMPVGPGVSPQPGFFSRGVWLPVVVTFSSGQAKST